MSGKGKRKADEAADGPPSDKGVASQRPEFARRKEAYHDRVVTLNDQLLTAMRKRVAEQEAGTAELVSFDDIIVVYNKAAKKIRSQFGDIIKYLEEAEPVAPEGARVARKVSGLYMIGQNDNGQLGLGEVRRCPPDRPGAFHQVINIPRLGRAHPVRALQPTECLGASVPVPAIDQRQEQQHTHRRSRPGCVTVNDTNLGQPSAAPQDATTPSFLRACV